MPTTNRTIWNEPFAVVRIDLKAIDNPEYTWVFVTFDETFLLFPTMNIYNPISTVGSCECVCFVNIYIKFNLFIKFFS